MRIRSAVASVAALVVCPAALAGSTTVILDEFFSGFPAGLCLDVPNFGQGCGSDFASAFGSMELDFSNFSDPAFVELTALDIQAVGVLDMSVFGGDYTLTIPSLDVTLVPPGKGEGFPFGQVSGGEIEIENVKVSVNETASASADPLLCILGGLCSDTIGLGDVTFDSLQGNISIGTNSLTIFDFEGTTQIELYPDSPGLAVLTLSLLIVGDGNIPPQPEPCPGDVDGDDLVNSVDLNVLLGNFGATVTPGTDGDLDGNGSVDSADLNLLLGNFGTAC